MSDKFKKLSMAQRVEILSRLRDARAKVLRDAESFREASTVLEFIGQIVRGKIGNGLKCYENAVLSVIQITAASHVEEAKKLFDVVREARNMAVHEGAWARHLNTRLVDLFLILEEAIMAQMKLAEDLMVRNPVTAEPWHLVSHVRSAMLANSFSAIPIYHAGKWRILTDRIILNLNYRATNAEEKRKVLATRIEKAISENWIEPEEALQCEPKKPIIMLVHRINHLPVLVIDTNATSADNGLRGIITAFDLL